MIHGSGLLATAFRDQCPDIGHWTVFARGVSNSSETLSAAFAREQDMLDEVLRTAAPVVYFSSCALLNPVEGDSAYLAHKRKMEAKVLSANAENVVFRLPQVVGRTGNPNTLTNFLRDRILTGTSFSIWRKAERNLIDVDDVVVIAAELMRERTEQRVVNIAAERSMAMPEIVALFERVLGTSANFSLQDRGDPLRVDSTLAVSVAARLGIDLGAGNAERVVRKYYAH